MCSLFKEDVLTEDYGPSSSAFDLDLSYVESRQGDEPQRQA